MDTISKQVAQIESIIPQSALITDIEEAEQVLKEIQENDFSNRFRFLLKIGSFYIESKALDKNKSIEAAKRYFQEAQRIAYLENNNQWIVISVSETAGCLSEEYMLSGDQECLLNAKRIYEELIEKCDRNGMTEHANSNRINYSRLLQNSKQGDRFSNYDKAITLLRQALENSSEEALGERFSPEIYGRTLYNLGVALCKQSEEPHTQEIYLNEAVDCFQKALLFRPADIYPLGRASVLRALASVYHRSQGADSRAHAVQLAEEAYAEAVALETKAGLTKEKAGWAKAKESTSALHWSLETLNSVAQNRDNIMGAIEHHKLNINRIPRDQQPFLWAEWLGGYAVLIGRIGIEDSNLNFINESRNAFINAIDAVPENTDPHQYMILFRELGRVCHQAGDWEGSLYANKKAVEIGLNLSDNAGTDISRTNELESFTRAIHFAAFAAAQLNLGEEATELAEIGRALWMDEAIILSSIRLSSLSTEFKSKIDETQASILELERQEHELLDQGLSGIGRRLENYLGLAFGEAIKMRMTGDPEGIETKRVNELTKVRIQLQELHEQMSLMLNSIKKEKIISKRPNYNQINEIVLKAGFPLVYLISSAWGSIAIIVNNRVEILQIPKLHRSEIQELLNAENGYINNISHITGELEISLENIQKILDEHLIPPLVSWCKQNEIESIGIIGLGDIGMLPIQVSTVPAGLSIHLLPSARALNLSLNRRKVIDPSKIKLLTIGDMNSNGLPPLKYSGIESLVFEDLFRSTGASVYDSSSELTLASIESEINNATHIHFSCHGNFTPFSPLNSVLYLDGDEKLSIENLLRPALRFFGTELVILSACNSASVEHWKTPDETIGFPATFLAAGAKTVIAAQWPVSDRATFILMQQFCKELLRNNFDASRSLLNAQIWLQKATKQEIRDAIIQIHGSLSNNEMRAKSILKELQANIESLDNEYPFKDRQYWAGFVCVGA